MSSPITQVEINALVLALDNSKNAKEFFQQATDAVGPMRFLELQSKSLSELCGEISLGNIFNALAEVDNRLNPVKKTNRKNFVEPD